MAVAQGKAVWASIQAPNTTYEPVYSIDLVVDKDTAKRLESEGLDVKKKDDELVVKFKRKAFRKDGTPNTKPDVVDAHKQPVTDLVGNGSIVKVAYTPFEWSYAGKSGVTGWLNAVQVLELVPYSSGGVGEFEEEESDMPVDSKDDPFDD